jgi:hypothetical protein
MLRSLDARGFGSCGRSAEIKSSGKSLWVWLWQQQEVGSILLMRCGVAQEMDTKRVSGGVVIGDVSQPWCGSWDWANPMWVPKSKSAHQVSLFSIFPRLKKHSFKMFATNYPIIDYRCYMTTSLVSSSQNRIYCKLPKKVEISGHNLHHFNCKCCQS